MNMQNDRVVIITGGSSGIGRAAALRFANQGDKVLITGRRAGPIEQTAAEHRNIAGLVADTASTEDANRTIAEAVGKWGRLDALVNNAGAGAILPLSDAAADRIDDILSVNVVGPSLLARAALPHLKATQGTIINISSTFGHRPAAGLSHYAASKAALEQLTRCWALELAPFGIRVNAVAAGPTESGALTGMMGLSAEQAEAVKDDERARIPLRRRGVPDDIAPWIVQLAGPASQWITGQVLAVDGGLGLT
ncbi:SDR family NAD(P)-dependent oxidoreductase [Bradyrhizobium sp. SEMIA]|uniref:SDR family NAD(P)-dependent oxidoreductase n=1 Tax=Bradyrhizobium sp. SEMIA TaxID=2597515 RepID=UPI0018A4DD55|nr:SDR family oxidoreductase [Bradyrhizobium sp. SEMIA]QOG18679.1 SDR family oxidoreductase [Bradyrhizobium sp. SEMIA]